MRWAGHAACTGEDRDVNRVFVGKPEGQRPLGGHRRRYEIILRWIFRKWVGAWAGSSWLRTGTGGGHWWCGKETSGSIKCGEFLV
jgi:hypothetical protein